MANLKTDYQSKLLKFIVSNLAQIQIFSVELFKGQARKFIDLDKIIFSLDFSRTCDIKTLPSWYPVYFVCSKLISTYSSS